MKTYRYSGHSRSDPATYRPDGELDEWLARDPIDIYAAGCRARALLDADAVAAMRRRDRRRGRPRPSRRRSRARSPSESDMFAHVYALLSGEDHEDHRETAEAGRDDRRDRDRRVARRRGRRRSARVRPLANVETDKAIVELPSPLAGTVVELLVAQGEEATTGDDICVIEQ